MGFGFGLGFVRGSPRPPIPPPVTLETWSPDLVAGFATLTNEDRTAQGGFGELIGEHGYAAGKRYFAIHPEAGHTALGLGFIRAGYVRAGDEWLGGGVQPGVTVGFYFDGTVFVGGGVVAAAPGWASLDTVHGVLDVTAKRLWLKVNGGDWNNNPAADPVSGADPLNLPGMLDGTWHLGLIVGDGAAKASLVPGEPPPGIPYFGA